MSLRRLGLLVVCAGLGAVPFLSAPVGAQDAESGEQVYVVTCGGCHGVDGRGTPRVFPPLVDNPKSLDADYVADVIRNGLSGPITVDGTTYNADMPALPHLTDVQVADIVAFLATNFETAGTGGGLTTETTIPPVFAAPAGSDADRGEDLFIGSTKFANGGLACIACHTAGGRGNLGGSSLGPDLTNVLASFGGPQGLVGLMSAPAFPVMREAYADKQLTEQERLDLAAFFVEASSQSDKDSGDAMLVVGLVGSGALFGAMIVIRPFTGAGYSRRLRRNA